MNDKIENAMTVAELIERLQDMDPEARVFFCSPYGDIGNTIQALPVSLAEGADTSFITESAYSHSGLERIGDELAFDRDEPDMQAPVVFLT